MNLQDMIRRVQRSFGDSAEAQIYVTDIIDWLNDAQVILVRDLELLQKVATLDVDNTTASGGWPMPQDFIKTALMTFNNNPLVYVPYQEVKGYTNNPPADPGWFYVWGGKIIAYPVPVSRGVGLVKLTYVRMPVSMKASGDVPEIPEHFHLDLIRYCLLRAKELNEDEQAVNRLNQEWVAAVSESKFASNPSENSYPVVRDYAGDMW